MKHKFSKIGEYGIKFEPVNGYVNKNGKKVHPYMRRVEFRWNNKNS